MQLGRKEDPYNIAKQALSRDLQGIKTGLATVEREQLLSNGPSFSTSSEVVTSLQRDVNEFKTNLGVLDQAISASRRSPAVFGLSENEINMRVAFLNECRSALEQAQTRLDIQMRKANNAQGSRTRDLSFGGGRGAVEDKFILNEAQHHLSTEVEQDRRLQDIARVAERLAETAQTINQELNEQAVLMDEFDTEVDDQQGAVNQVIKRVGVVLKTNNRRQIKQVLYLVLIFFVLLLLLLV